MITRTLALAALLPIGLGACATMAPPPQPTGPCRISEDVRMRYTGVKFHERMREEIKAMTDSRIARILRPGVPATMDFQEDRLNILLDDTNQIVGLKCG